ncbi:MAG: polysaccharide deacetylase family protein [Candidatus Thorarchaeota archaeon]
MMLIEKLGFETTDKVVILHIDDVGFSHASNVATFECLDFGVASCGSAIVPAPWFLETASICRKNPSYDIGVHITLTCEYELYRWRALSSIDPKTGLLDSERSLWRTSEEAIGRITTQAAEVEMRAQVQMAIDNGIDVTHIDTHMGTVMAPKFLPSYLKVARDFNVPAFLPRVSRSELEARGLGSLADFYLKLIDSLEKKGTSLIDNIITETMGDSPNKTEYYCNLFKELKPGITHFLFHPAKMSPELNAIVPETAKWRDLDYQAFIDPKLKECVKKLDLKIIGYREIREVLREN